MKPDATVRVCLMIPTHALPPLSYRVPERLAGRLKVGSAVVAPLSGRSRLGFVLSTGEDDGRASEALRSVAPGLSLPEATLRLCRRISEISGSSLAAVIRSALPPGVETDRYRVSSKLPGFERGEVATRRELRTVLGAQRLREVETSGGIILSPRLPEPTNEEWTAVNLSASEVSSRRAPKQGELLRELRDSGGEAPSRELLARSGVSRATLRALAARGAVRLEERPTRRYLRRSSGPIDESLGELDDESDDSWSGEFEAALEGEGARIVRLPSDGIPGALISLISGVVGRGGRVLVIAPETSAVDRTVELLVRELPSGSRVCAYHSGLGRDRAAVWKAASRGELDVLVGTRTAALLPLRGLGGAVVLDEPNPAHRARPGHEGVPVHTRDLLFERSGIEGFPLFFLSPYPSLRLFALKDLSRVVSELPPRRSERWPQVRLVDMRGSGATLSSTLLETCREALGGGLGIGVVTDRLGYATSVSCSACGAVRLCPTCDLPLSLRETKGRAGRVLVCGRCGYTEDYDARCPECGSTRSRPTGIAMERLRDEVSGHLDCEVGLLSARTTESEDAPVIVGTPGPLLSRRWDLVVVPDADALISGGWMGAAERGFRTLYRAAESAGGSGRLLVQTRSPESYALRCALREDYRSFAAAELPRLRELGYPPFAHLAAITLYGPESLVRLAVESDSPENQRDEDRERGVSVSGLVSVPSGDERPAWRMFLRSGERETVARLARRLSRRIAKTTGARSKGLRVSVEIDPEEV